MKIYLDDVRTPMDKDWMVVRNYHEFVNLVQKLGIKNIVPFHWTTIWVTVL